MIIGWIPAVAGGGATSLLLATATRLAYRGQRVVIVDADPLAELSRRLRLRPTRPLDDIFRWNEAEAKQATPRHVAQNVFVVPADPGRFAGSGVACNPAALTSCTRALEAEFGCVFIDLPPAGAPAAAAALSLIDAFVAVTPATGSGIGSLPALLRLALASRRASGPIPKLLAVATGPVRDREASQAIGDRLVATCGLSCLCTAVPYDPEVEQASLAGYASINTSSESFATALSSLATVVLSSLTNAKSPTTPPPDASDAVSSRNAAPTATDIFAA